MASAIAMGVHGFPGFRRCGFARAALLWVLAWVGAAGFFLHQAVPSGPCGAGAAGASGPVVNCSAPAAPCGPAKRHYKRIEDVRAGERVLARDPEAGGPARPAEVCGLIRDFADGLVHVNFDTPGCGEGTVTSTRFHPFWTQNRGWVQAKDLVAGDALENLDAAALPVARVSVEPAYARSYNLTVADVHTYFVRAENHAGTVLVHNADTPIAIHSRYADGTPVYKGQQPGKIAGPDPAAGDAPHTVFQQDTVNDRLYKRGNMANVVAPSGILILQVTHSRMVVLDLA